MDLSQWMRISRTGIAGLYAIGDCIRAAGAASTVMAVEDGKLAAKAIDRQFTRSAALPRRANYGGPSH